MPSQSLLFSHYRIAPSRVLLDTCSLRNKFYVCVNIPSLALVESLLLKNFSLKKKKKN